jgi:D-amino-acid dehydrogenase
VIVIVGGGLVGLHTALFLTDMGSEVTIVDRGAMGGGAARGNAGFLCSSLVAPLAGPGLIGTALRSLTNPTGALRVRPKALPAMAGWLAHFARASTAGAFEQGRAALASLNSELPALVKHLGDAGVDMTLSPDMVVPFHDVAFGEKFLRELQPMRSFGADIPTSLSSGDDMRSLVPALTDHVRAGFTLPGDRSVDPRHLVDTLIEVLRERGVTLIENAPITSIARSGERVRHLVTSSGRIDGREFVLAAGAGTNSVARHLGLRFPVVPGQGYNVVLPATSQLSRPVIVEEAHAVATPLSDRIRLGGTMEFTGSRATFDGRRVDAIVRSMRLFFDLDWDRRSDTWAGSRPMSPDGLPLIGRPNNWSNLTLASGHGMWGLTLAPATGLAVAQLLVDGSAKADLSAFSPNRFSSGRVGAARR